MPFVVVPAPGAQPARRIEIGPAGLLLGRGHACDVQLRQALATVRLDSRTVARVDAELTEIENAVQPERPDRDRAARATERLTGLLTAAGAFVTAGGALIRPLQALATWLGPLGQQVLAMIPGLR
jgi:hypothetical protein